MLIFLFIFDLHKPLSLKELDAEHEFNALRKTNIIVIVNISVICNNNISNASSSKRPLLNQEIIFQPHLAQL